MMFWEHPSGDIGYAAILLETMKYLPLLEGQQWRAESKWENKDGKTWTGDIRFTWSEP